METWRDQIRLLGIFHWVVAGLTALFSLMPVIHLVIGIMMVTGSFPDDGKGSPPPPMFGWLFIAMAVGFIVVGLGFSVLIALAGRYLQRQRNWTFCVVIAALACMLFPFGTALGVFTIIVLMKPEVKAAFTANATPVASTPS